MSRDVPARPRGRRLQNLLEQLERAGSAALLDEVGDHRDDLADHVGVEAELVEARRQLGEFAETVTADRRGDSTETASQSAQQAATTVVSRRRGRDEVVESAAEVLRKGGELTGVELLLCQVEHQARAALGLRLRDSQLTRQFANQVLHGRIFGAGEPGGQRAAAAKARRSRERARSKNLSDFSGGVSIRATSRVGGATAGEGINMNTVEIIGNPASSYVRSALWASFEKGAAARVVPADLGAAEYRQVHPFGKMPALRHDGVELFETAAIVHYVDAAFAGPRLLPASPADLGRAVAWMSAFVDYAYPALVREYALRYIFPAGADGAPDRAAIENAVPRLREVMSLANAQYERTPWIAGDALSGADVLWLPAIDTIRRLPEGETALADAPGLARALAAASERPAWQQMTAVAAR